MSKYLFTILAIILVTVTNFNSEAAKKKSNRKLAQNTQGWTAFMEEQASSFHQCKTKEIKKIEGDQIVGKFTFSRSDISDPDGTLTVRADELNCNIDLSLVTVIYTDVLSKKLLIQSLSGSNTYLKVYDLAKNCSKASTYTISAESESDAGAQDLIALDSWLKSLMRLAECGK